MSLCWFNEPLWEQWPAVAQKPPNNRTDVCDAAVSKAPTGFADLIIVGYNIMNFQTDVMEMLHNANGRILMVWWFFECINSGKLNASQITNLKASIETTLHCIRDHERTMFVTFKSQHYDVICSITFHIKQCTDDQTMKSFCSPQMQEQISDPAIIIA